MDVITECSDGNEEREMERCKPRATGVMKKANGSLLRQEYCCIEVARETGQRE